jgi:hypothetical protein
MQMPILRRRTDSLPSLVELPLLRCEHTYTKMIARLSQARPERFSVSLEKIHDIDAREKPSDIKNNLVLYQKLKFTLFDIKNIENILVDFHLLSESEKIKFRVIPLRETDKELKEILSASDIYRKVYINYIANKDLYLTPVAIDLSQSLHSNVKIYYHLLLHGLHFGHIHSPQTLADFKNKR